jgi:hypothetical protein
MVKIIVVTIVRRFELYNRKALGSGESANPRNRQKYIYRHCASCHGMPLINWSTFIEYNNKQFHFKLFISVYSPVYVGVLFYNTPGDIFHTRCYWQWRALLLRFTTTQRRSQCKTIRSTGS